MLGPPFRLVPLSIQGNENKTKWNDDAPYGGMGTDSETLPFFGRHQSESIKGREGTERNETKQQAVVSSDDNRNWQDCNWNPMALRASLSCTDLARDKVLRRLCRGRCCAMNHACTGQEQDLPLTRVQSISGYMRSSFMTCHITGGFSMPQVARVRSIRLFATESPECILSVRSWLNPAEGVTKPATLTVDQVRKGVIKPGIDCITENDAAQHFCTHPFLYLLHFV